MIAFEPFAGVSQKDFIDNEKEVVKDNMKAMLAQSKIEMQRFKPSGEVYYLQEACEKLFNAFELYVSYVSGQRLYSHQSMYKLAKSNIKNLIRSANDLHRFFYNAQNEMPIEEATKIYYKIYNKIKPLINRIN